MEIIRYVQKWGNSSGILLPKEWLNKEVKITLIDRSLEIKEEVFKILSPYLDEIMGIYITGSYARGEEESDSDIDIIVISNNVCKEIISGKYNVSIIPLDTLEKTLRSNPIMILPRLLEAKPITNSHLLNKLREIKINKDSFKDFVRDCKRILKINKELVGLEDPFESEYLDSNNIIYSLVLRLRGIYYIKCILDNKKYSKKNFLNWIKKSIGNNYLDVYSVYKEIKDNKKSEVKISIKTAKQLIELVNREIKNL
jgi:predicted nucleotidyltransferase